MPEVNRHLLLARAGLCGLLLTLSCALGVDRALHAQESCRTLLGQVQAERYRVAAIADRRVTHEELWRALAPYLETGGVRVTEVGRSVQARALYAVTFGTGPTRVLLWSQMHGDESTATMALADLIRFFAEGGDDPLRQLIGDRLTVVMVPMLNPDGAERFQRRNAAGVDVNRDARRLATPEAQALKGLRDSLAPAFGFNLHDQGARNTAGPGGAPVAIALLAPATDSSRGYGRIRARARDLVALMAGALSTTLPGRVAKYDDTFNERAFGDLIQRWGTSTVLIESGALPDDPDKQQLRAVNAMLLLTALEAIATDRYLLADAATYERLPFNEGVPYDVLLLGGEVVTPDGGALTLDLALQFDDPVARRGLVLVDVGDLAGTVAMDTLNVEGLFLHVSTPSTLDPARWALVPREPIAVVVRRAPSDDTEVVLRLP